MNAATRFFCSTFALTLPMTASADPLAPFQPGTFTLHEHTASIYYTEQSESFEVVATLAAANGEGAPARFIAQLMPGQTATVSVGAFEPGTPPVVLELHRKGDQLFAEVRPLTN